MTDLTFPLSALVEDDRLRAQFAEAEARHAEALLAVVANALSLQSQLDEQVSVAEEVQLTEEWARMRAELVEQISRLEAEASLAQKTSAELSAKEAEGERALAQARAEAEEAPEKLAEAERGHAQALAEALGAQEASRVSLAGRIARAEAAAAAAENARAELVAQKAGAGRALESVQAESEALVAKVAGMEKDHSTALTEATRREDAQRRALDAERQRAEQLEKDVAAFVEGEAKLSREWQTSRAEWSDRIRLLEDAAEEAVASLQAERETLVTRLSEIERDRDRAEVEAVRRENAQRRALDAERQRAEQLENEAAVAERESTQGEAWEAARNELLARIAQLEANEVLTEKARTELLNRKRDSDRALAATQAERAALLKKLAIADHALDQAQAAVVRYDGGHGERAAGEASLEDGHVASERAVPSDPPDAASKRNAGGLSALANLWNAAAIKRPFGRKPKE